MAKGLEEIGNEAGVVEAAGLREAQEVGGGFCADGGAAAAGYFAKHDRRAYGAFGAVVVGSDDTGVEQECEQVRFVFSQSFSDAAAVGVCVFRNAHGM